MEPHISRRFSAGEVSAYDSVLSILWSRKDGGSVVRLASVLDIVFGMILVNVKQAANPILVGPKRGEDRLRPRFIG